MKHVRDVIISLLTTLFFLSRVFFPEKKNDNQQTYGLKKKKGNTFRRFSHVATTGSTGTNAHTRRNGIAVFFGTRRGRGLALRLLRVGLLQSSSGLDAALGNRPAEAEHLYFSRDHFSCSLADCSTWTKKKDGVIKVESGRGGGRGHGAPSGCQSCTARSLFSSLSNGSLSS